MENIDMTESKQMLDFRVVRNEIVSKDVALIYLVPADENVKLSEFDIRPGKFVQIKTPSNATFLRRPISVCNVDSGSNELWLLVRNAGAGSKAIMDSPCGSVLNIILPLGNGFDLSRSGAAPLLICGGVGVAPLLMSGIRLSEAGIKPTFLIGARSKDMILLDNHLSKYGDTYISTDDGSFGEKGVVTRNSILARDFTSIYCCGPLPMMKAVATIAYQRDLYCEVSLENVMGCGVGACLCCVEKTVDGNLCVCKDGPVFNIEKLLWRD